MIINLRESSSGPDRMRTAATILRAICDQLTFVEDQFESNGLYPSCQTLENGELPGLMARLARLERFCGSDAHAMFVAKVIGLEDVEENCRRLLATLHGSGNPKGSRGRICGDK
jgi:hypothetical protein